MNKNFNVSALSFKKALEKVGGGSGGSASKYKQPEWGAEENGVILPETSCAADPESGMAPITSHFNGSLIVDNVYTVVFNGVEYKCTAVSAGGEGIVLGNAAAMGLPDAAESDAPFVLMQFYPAAAAAMGIEGMAVPLNGFFEFTILVKGEIPHTIPERYLGDTGEYVVVFDGAHGFSVPFAEIMAAINSGKRVYMYDGGERYFLTSVVDTEINFATVRYFNDSSVVISAVSYLQDGTANKATVRIGN